MIPPLLLHFCWYGSGRLKSCIHGLNSYLYPPICILLSYPFQGTLNHTSGDPVAPIRGKKKHLLPVTELHFPVHCSEWLKSGCSSLNSYLYPPLLLSLSYSSPRTLNQTLGTQWPPLVPRKSPETTQNTSYFVIFSLVSFSNAKIMWQQPRFIPMYTRTGKSISPIPRDSESYIWRPCCLQQSPEMMQNTPYAAPFSLSCFWMMEITWKLPKFIPISTPPHYSISPITRDPDLLIWGSCGPDTTQDTPYTAKFFLVWFCMV